MALVHYLFVFVSKWSAISNDVSDEPLTFPVGLNTAGHYRTTGRK